MSLALRSLIAALVVGLGLGMSQPTQAQSVLGAQTWSDTVDFSPTDRVEIHNQTGSITVTTWDRPQVGYEVTLAPSESDSVLATDFAIDHSDEELSFGRDGSWSIRIPGLLTISPDAGGDPIGHYRIVMPKTASLDIDDFGSTIEVSDVEANVEVDTHEGSVTVRGVEGTLELETFSSTATASGLRGSAELETHSGRITAAFEEFAAASSAETHSGSLRFFLPTNTGFVLATDADSSQFTIDEAFGPPSKDDERWSFNGGGPDLSVEAFSGTVELRPLDAYAPSSR
jgi:hypothetical protein